MNKMKEINSKIKIRLCMICTMCYVILAYRNVSYAIGIKDSIYVTGTKKLFADALVAGQAIIAAVVLVLWVVWEIQKRANEDNEEARYSKRQRGSLIGLIVAETIGTFFGIIGGYYGVKFN